jgi:hypothetical protein
MKDGVVELLGIKVRILSELGYLDLNHLPETLLPYVFCSLPHRLDIIQLFLPVGAQGPVPLDQDDTAVPEPQPEQSIAGGTNTPHFDGFSEPLVSDVDPVILTGRADFHGPHFEIGTIEVQAHTSTGWTSCKK